MRIRLIVDDFGGVIKEPQRV